MEETKQITVKQVATADRFLSQSLPQDFIVDPGQYTFRVGDKEVRLAWKGGSLKAFADALNAKGDDAPLRLGRQRHDEHAGAPHRREGHGGENRLTLTTGAAADLGVKAGMLQRSPTASRQVQLSDKAVSTWTAPPEPGAVVIQNGTLTLNPGSELKVPVSPAATLNKNMVLELSVKVEQLPETPQAAIQPPPGPTVPSTGGIDFQGIHDRKRAVQDSPARLGAPEAPGEGRRPADAVHGRRRADDPPPCPFRLHGFPEDPDPRR